MHLVELDNVSLSHYWIARHREVFFSILLEAPFDAHLLHVLLGFDGHGLAETRRLLCTVALRIFVTENVAQFVRVGFASGPIVGVNAHLIVLVKHVNVALVKLVSYL